MVPLAFPTAIGVNVVLSVALCPGANTVSAPTPLTANPAPLTDTPAMVMFAFPLLVSVAPRELLVPTVTFPKLKFTGFEPNERLTAIAVPLTGMVRGELGALLASKIDPFAVPLAVAVNVTLKDMLWPAGSISGRLNPDVPNPAPETVTLEIVALPLPLLSSVIVCELVDPTITLGKVALAGLTESLACVRVGLGAGVGEPKLFAGLELITRPAQPLKNSEPQAAKLIAAIASIFAVLIFPAFASLLTHHHFLRSDPRDAMVRPV